MLRRLASLGVTVPYAGWRALRGQGRDQWVVLYYHGITADQSKSFDRQMRWLNSRYSIVPLQFLLSDRWHGRCISITFDDGLDNVRKHALPVLRELEIPATIFVVPGNLGRKPSWSMEAAHPDRQEFLSTAEQLKEYPSGLIEIGSHTMHHSDLPSLGNEALRWELAESKAALEAMLSRKVVSLSVPYGSYDTETIRIAEQLGYRIVVTCDPIVVRPGCLALPCGRFKVTPDDWGLEFRLKSSGAHEWRRTWQRIRGAPSSGAIESLHSAAVAAQPEFTR